MKKTTRKKMVIAMALVIALMMIVSFIPSILFIKEWKNCF